MGRVPVTGGPWRTPPEETVDLYPGLVVADDRVTGSVTFGVSRLPLWCTPSYLIAGWPEFTAEYGDPDDPDGTVCGVDADRFGAFLTHLFEARGEFARLLLVLADVERVEKEREATYLEVHAPGETIVRMDIGDGQGVPVPPAWWEYPDLAERVRTTLRRCLDTIEHKAPTTRGPD